MKKLLAVFVLALAAVLFFLNPDRPDALVVEVIDGDTLTVVTARKEYRIRLEGIDAPELSQPYGQQARDNLESLALDRHSVIEIQGEDRYGRTIAQVLIDGADLSLAQLQAGLAWHYKQYSDDATYAAAEYEARQQHKGLWAQLNPVAPWDYRHQLTPYSNGQER